ncbi:ECF RNA polymerase sigma factor SigD [Caulifigura coniformis]|uniref:ECF RNA polymerase sigma factor SigD n=1 Tax=Caulifigura coniformis TaxID=2527983 RepID=A0A517SC14_9PLAN|nr:sigma-70 family RNA polymerase sigma factor [Caulifigura coniformis]QDT53636.1 ECF RNA polymerase sigma factor SigD [Caulifigura coniformis]
MSDSSTDGAQPVPSPAEQRLVELLKEKQPQLLAYINRQLGSRLKQKVEAEDILQEATIDAVRRVAEFEQLQREPFGWLCQIAEHRLIDAHRRFFQSQKRAGEREMSIDADRADDGGKFADLLAVSMTTASQALSRNQKEFQLQVALQELPEETREVLRLRYVDGLQTKEIAERLGKTDGAIRVLLTRSVQKLQEKLTDAG